MIRYEPPSWPPASVPSPSFDSEGLKAHFGKRHDLGTLFAKYSSRGSSREVGGCIGSGLTVMKVLASCKGEMAADSSQPSRDISA